MKYIWAELKGIRSEETFDDYFIVKLSSFNKDRYLILCKITSFGNTPLKRSELPTIEGYQL